MPLAVHALAVAAATAVCGDLRTDCRAEACDFRSDTRPFDCAQTCGLCCADAEGWDVCGREGVCESHASRCRATCDLCPYQVPDCTDKDGLACTKAGVCTVATLAQRCAVTCGLCSNAAWELRQEPAGDLCVDTHRDSSYCSRPEACERDPLQCKATCGVCGDSACADAREEDFCKQDGVCNLAELAADCEATCGLCAPPAPQAPAPQTQSPPAGADVCEDTKKHGCDSGDCGKSRQRMKCRLTCGLCAPEGPSPSPAPSAPAGCEDAQGETCTEPPACRSKPKKCKQTCALCDSEWLAPASQASQEPDADTNAAAPTAWQALVARSPVVALALQVLLVLAAALSLWALVRRRRRRLEQLPSPDELLAKGGPPPPLPGPAPALLPEVGVLPEVVGAHEDVECPRWFDVECAIDGNGELYVCLQLKKCQRGWPLWPQDGEWVVQPGGDLTVYLETVVRAFAAEDDPARRAGLRGTLDGRRVVPYQALVPRDHWRVLFDALLKPFQDQRARYRRHYGGTAAPELLFGVAPVFRDVRRARHAAGEGEGEGAAAAAAAAADSPAQAEAGTPTVSAHGSREDSSHDGSRGDAETVDTHAAPGAPDSGLFLAHYRGVPVRSTFLHIPDEGGEGGAWRRVHSAPPSVRIDL